MCEPTTIMLAISLASTAAQQFGQRQSTKSQFGALARAREAQNEEIGAKAGREIGERVKQGRAEAARLRVASGEAGVGGNSFAAQLMDVAFQSDEDVGALDQDARFAQRASEAQFQSSLARIKNPGLLENTLKLVASGAAGYASGLQIANAGKIAETSSKLTKITGSVGRGF